MRTASTVLALMLALAIPIATQAQSTPAVEIGTQIGFSILRPATDNAESVFIIGIPGGQGNFLANSSLYAAFFPSESLVVEPEISLIRFSSDGDSFMLLGLTAGLKHLFAGTDVPSPFVGAEAGLLLESESDFDSNTDWVVGGSAGYRVPVRGALSVIFEGRYRRWLAGQEFATDLNEFTFGIGLGAIVPRA